MLFFMYIMLDTYTIIHIHQWVIVELIYWWDQNPSITHWQQPYTETNLSSTSVASWVFKTLCLMQGPRGCHYFKDCYIQGEADFIFGSGQSYYDVIVIVSKV